MVVPFCKSSYIYRLPLSNYFLSGKVAVEYLLFQLSVVAFHIIAPIIKFGGVTGFYYRKICQEFVV